MIAGPLYVEKDIRFQSIGLKENSFREIVYQHSGVWMEKQINLRNTFFIC